MSIPLEYTIKSSDFDGFDAVFDKLKSIIGSTDEADFVFNGESDKYYTGVVTSNKCDLPGRAIRKGSFVINCLFPFKRSTALKTVSVPTSLESNSAEFTIDYQGTYPSKPILRATFDDADVGGSYSDDGDCGYIAFIDDDENIVQLGNPEAIDVDAYANTVTRINNAMSSVSGWQASGGKTWRNKLISGSMSVASISDTYFGRAKGWTKPCAVPAYGSNPAGWHGPILWKTLNAATGALNWEAKIVHRMACNGPAEVGSFECGAYNDSSGTLKMVAGFVIEKTASGTNGVVRYIVNGVQVGTNTIDLSYYNTSFGYCKRTQLYKTTYYKNKKKTKRSKKKTKYSKKVTNGYTYTQCNLNSLIKKSGKKVVFKIGNLAERTFAASEIELLAAHTLSLHFGQQKSIKPLNTNAVHSVAFTEYPAGVHFSALKNVFHAGDVVETDCSDGSVTLRRANTEEGHPAQQYGALGNDWEDFSLGRGVNHIKVVWSDWVPPEHRPAIEIEYNEVYI